MCEINVHYCGCEFCSPEHETMIQWLHRCTHYSARKDECKNGPFVFAQTDRVCDSTGAQRAAEALFEGQEPDAESRPEAPPPGHLTALCRLCYIHEHRRVVARGDMGYALTLLYQRLRSQLERKIHAQAPARPLGLSDLCLVLCAEHSGGFHAHALADGLSTIVCEDLAVFAAHDRGKWVDDRVYDDLTPHGHLDVVERLPVGVESLHARQRGNGGPQDVITRWPAPRHAVGGDVVESQLGEGAFEVTLAFGDDAKLQRANASVHDVEIFFQESTVGYRREYEVWSLVGIAEDIPDERLVDAHTVLYENDSAVRREAWNEGANGVGSLVRLDTHDEGVDGCDPVGRGLRIVVRCLVPEARLVDNDSVPLHRESGRRIESTCGMFCTFVNESDRVVVGERLS